MREISYGLAMAEGMMEALDRDERIILINGGYGGLSAARSAFDRLRRDYASRILNPPISELGSCGMAVGAAMTGLRPMVSVGTGSFIFEAFPQVINEAPQAYYNSAGQVTVPVVFHMYVGIRRAGAVQHSASPQSMFWNVPGLQVVCPSSPADVKGLVKTALLRSMNPTIFIDHSLLLDQQGPVPEEEYEVPFGQASVRREGSDVSIVAVGVMVGRALEAAERLAREDGLSCEVVDPRTLVPLDKAAILASVRKTGRAVVADESQRSCGVASELAAILAEEAFSSLKAPVKRVAIPNVPIIYAKTSEEAITPTADTIVAAVRSITR